MVGGVGPPAEMLSAITFVSGRTVSTRAHVDEREARSDEPGHRERARRDVLAGEERPEDGRAEDRAEDGAEEDVRDAARPALGRVHVAGGGADEQA